MQIYFKKEKPCLLRQAQDDRAVYLFNALIFYAHISTLNAKLK
jgi:hypothetical protein